MANANYSVGIYPSLTQDMVVKIYEVDINGATSEVGSTTIPERNGLGVPTPGAGHQVPYTGTFSGIDNVTHEVRLYTASGSLIDYYRGNATVDTVTLFDPIRFRIGDGGANTPAAGSSAYVNTAMAGLADTDYVAIRTGYGPMIEGIHITNNVLGGFQLFQPGDVFSGDPAEEWTILRKPVVLTTPVNDSVVGKQWGPTAGNPNMYVDVSSAVSCAATHLRKVIRLAGSSAEYSFTSGYIPPVGYPFRITNFGTYTPGSAAPKVKFTNAALKWGNTTLAEIEIPFSGTAEFVWDGTIWNCTMYMQIPSTTPVTGDVLGMGRYALGDISEGLYTITHGLNITGNYKVLGSIYSLASNYARDNTVTWAVREFTANSFKLGIQEIYGEVQNISFDWVIVKAP